MARALTGPAGRDRWIPWAFVAFFGVVLAANGAMIWIAFATWTGLETEGAYQKGLAYNQTLAEAKAQEELGWQVDLSVAARGGRFVDLELKLADRNGNLMQDAWVTAAFVRPTHAGHDLEVAMPHIHAGLYGAQAALPFPGIWELHLTVESGDDTYRMRRRIYLKP
jgi:nitrogen fixation protein FixH